MLSFVTAEILTCIAFMTGRLIPVMPSEYMDGFGSEARETEGAARHRKNTDKQSNSNHSDTPAYSEEQLEAVKRYKLCFLYRVHVVKFSHLTYSLYCIS